jgi:hypothetical protein
MGSVPCAEERREFHRQSPERTKAAQYLGGSRLDAGFFAPGCSIADPRERPSFSSQIYASRSASSLESFCPTSSRRSVASTASSPGRGSSTGWQSSSWPSPDPANEPRSQFAFSGAPPLQKRSGWRFGNLADASSANERLALRLREPLAARLLQLGRREQSRKITRASRNSH